MFRHEAAEALEHACSNGEGSADIDALLAAVVEHLDPVIAGLRSLEGGSARTDGVPLLHTSWCSIALRVQLI